jgi:hypothetical protein
MERAWWCAGIAAATGLLVACGDAFDPVGVYVGSSRSTVETSVLTAEVVDGRGQARSTSRQETESLRVVVTRVAPGALALALGENCTNRVTQRPEPNHHMADVDVGQRCSIQGADLDEPAVFTGSVVFSRTEPETLQFTLRARVAQGAVDTAGYTHVVAARTFQGQREGR